MYEKRITVQNVLNILAVEEHVAVGPEERRLLFTCTSY